MAHPGGVLHSEGPDEKDWFVCRSINSYGRKKELPLFLHGDGVLGKLVRAFGKKYDRSRMMSHMLLVPFPSSSPNLQLFSGEGKTLPCLLCTIAGFSLEEGERTFMARG